MPELQIRMDFWKKISTFSYFIREDRLQEVNKMVRLSKEQHDDCWKKLMQWDVADSEHQRF